MVNSQLARSSAYTWPIIQGGGNALDVMQLELGLFPNKEQREWSQWLYGTKKKKLRTKKFKKSDSRIDRQGAIDALDYFAR